MGLKNWPENMQPRLENGTILFLGIMTHFNDRTKALYLSEFSQNNYILYMLINLWNMQIRYIARFSIAFKRIVPKKAIQNRY